MSYLDEYNNNVSLKILMEFLKIILILIKKVIILNLLKEVWLMNQI